MQNYPNVMTRIVWREREFIIVALDSFVSNGLKQQEKKTNLTAEFWANFFFLCINITCRKHLKKDLEQLRGNARENHAEMEVQVKSPILL